jgi:broad specificity phosphatase PhoE
MKLYCVRHGESTGNRDRLHQSPNTPLSDIGEDQAQFVAHRFKTIAIDHILSSPYKRAHQTAKAIQSVTGKPLTILAEAHEITKPKITHNKSYEHPDVRPFYEQFDQQYANPNWHFDDEENYFDAFNRAHQVFTLINARPEKNLVLVSHGTFLTIFLTYMLFPDKFNLELFLRLHEFAHLKNTGITMYERNRQGRWYLRTLNDFAHLG